jgi:hypothetical protein
MGLIYAIENFIDTTTIIHASSEDSLYVTDNLFNVRPSYPFRFLGGRGSPRESPEWLCFDFGETVNPTLIAGFNHNFLGTSSGFYMNLEANNVQCSGFSGVGGFFSGTFVESLGDRIIPNHRNFYQKFTLDQSYRYMRFEVHDVDVFIPQLGDLFIGQWQQFSGNVKLQPGRGDGPEFIFGQQQTHYGQDWVDFRSEKEANFTLRFTGLGSQTVYDEFHVFLRNVAANNGKFIFIPNDSYPFVFYVVIKNVAQAIREVSGSFGYLRNWEIEVKSLTEGIYLLT